VASAYSGGVSSLATPSVSLSPTAARPLSGPHAFEKKRKKKKQIPPSPPRHNGGPPKPDGESARDNSSTSTATSTLHGRGDCTLRVTTVTPTPDKRRPRCPQTSKRRDDNVTRLVTRMSLPVPGPFPRHGSTYPTWPSPPIGLQRPYQLKLGHPIGLAIPGKLPLRSELPRVRRTVSGIHFVHGPDGHLR
jgi:hypothetical protein